MSGSLNKVMLIGNLGKDPETHNFENGGLLVRFPIATSETYKNREGNKVESTEWHNVVVTRTGLAEVCQKYLHKGDKIFVEGRIKTRQWQDKEGQTRYSTEIHVSNMTMLSGKPTGVEPSSGGSQSYTAEPSHAAGSGASDSASGPDGDDDLPF